MAYKYFWWRSLRPPFGKPLNLKSPDIPAIYHSQKASPTGIADMDTNKRHIFASAFYLFLILHFCILSIRLILSGFSAEIVIQALVSKHDVVRG